MNGRHKERARPGGRLTGSSGMRWAPKRLHPCCALSSRRRPLSSQTKQPKAATRLHYASAAHSESSQIGCDAAAADDDDDDCLYYYYHFQPVSSTCCVSRRAERSRCPRRSANVGPLRKQHERQQLSLTLRLMGSEALTHCERTAAAGRRRPPIGHRSERAQICIQPSVSTQRPPPPADTCRDWSVCVGAHVCPLAALKWDHRRLVRPERSQLLCSSASGDRRA
jgi:hypothetical protein